MVPIAFLVGSADKFSISATIFTISKSSLIFSPAFADIGTQIVFPPQSSDMRFNSANSFFTFSISASGLSILFIATTNGRFSF